VIGRLALTANQLGVSWSRQQKR